MAGVFMGPLETKVRPAVVIVSAPVSRRASGCAGRDSHHEADHGAKLNRLHPSGLAIRGLRAESGSERMC